jgi:ankyrin repeat protein
MSLAPLTFASTLQDYEEHAKSLHATLLAGDPAAEWRLKWNHPRFRGKSIDAVRAASLELDDARLVLALEHGFESWANIAAFADAVQHPGPIADFELAVEAVVDGDLAPLRAMLRAHPALVRARSTRRHRATLLHYIAANGVEGERQRTPPNAVEIAKTLLDAGAKPDAVAEMYDTTCTTMSMLVSSSPPAAAGLQGALAETLLDYGAEVRGKSGRWQSPILTALTFGFLDTAKRLAARGAAVDSLHVVAGLGRLDDVARLLPHADARSRHAAIALASQLGHVDVVRLLLDSGEDPNRYNPDAMHSHSTPLHQAVSADHPDVVRLLAEGGARLDIRDKIYQGTPLDWAVYLERTAIAEYLRVRVAAISS